MSGVLNVLTGVGQQARRSGQQQVVSSGLQQQTGACNFINK
jgi:hypothetical protein